MVEPDDKLAYFQAVTGLEDRNLCTEILEAHGWDLESAVSTMTEEANASSSALAENSDSTNLARNLDSTNMVGNFNSTSSHWEGVDGSDAQNHQIVPNPAAPGLVWKLVTLPFSVVRGGFGLLSGVVGFGMWVAGGVLSHSFNVIGWGPGQGQSDGNQNAPLVSLSSGAAEAVSFIAGFEREYGEFHPAFQRAGFMEALQTSREEFKLLFVYLHSPEHPNTMGFCQDTLCSEVVVDFVNQNFVTWGGNVRASEGFKMSNSLKASTFPFCAVVMPATNQRIALLQQVEGPKTPTELLEVLQRVVEESGAVLAAARIEEEERRHNRRLREEQDAAYQAALEADQARERERQAEAERLQREAAEAERRRKEQEEAMARAAQEAAEREAALERRRQEKAMALGVEPEKGSDVTQVLVRFPNGERKERRFYSSAMIQSLYDYVDSLNCLNVEKYSLVTNFPRVVYGPDKFALSLREAGLHPQASLYVQVEDA
ncbi:plant UBX domain-containing protein 10 [Cryptomeria japonica]|uniref:plant UBX domain-containing protein 10 n=1 Tax=Cryptomeria japonica TaxID=3369 RepID=UPI0025AD6636|nr:plant UBX domain-containing protein 10 [Cryptomeria japonica]XP_057850928.1 plant UBX domain-containing protein 10 [Cryptomeria japonica]XP_057850929.1 plant UBX domain-containing protein 10 [Cryptomeria japonica]